MKQLADSIAQGIVRECLDKGAPSDVLLCGVLLIPSRTIRVDRFEVGTEEETFERRIERVQDSKNTGKETIFHFTAADLAGGVRNKRGMRESAKKHSRITVHGAVIWARAF